MSIPVILMILHHSHVRQKEADALIKSIVPAPAALRAEGRRAEHHAGRGAGGQVHPFVDIRGFAQRTGHVMAASSRDNTKYTKCKHNDC